MAKKKTKTKSSKSNLDPNSSLWVIRLPKATRAILQEEIEAIYESINRKRRDKKYLVNRYNIFAASLLIGLQETKRNHERIFELMKDKFNITDYER